MFNDYETVMVPIGDITWAKRHRAYNPKKAKELAESIGRVGLINPITVLKVWEGYRLIAGLHRLEACKMVGWSEIPTHSMEASELEAELVELDENLMHSGLTMLEQSEQIQRRREIVMALESDGQRSRRLRHQGEFATEVAEQMGFADRQVVYDRLRVARDIPDDVKDVIRGTDLANNKAQLLELAQLKDDPEQQRRVAEVIAEEYAENGQAPSVAMAQSILTAPQGATLGAQDKAALYAEVQTQRGPSVLLDLLYRIHSTSRWETGALLNGMDLHQRQRVLNDLPTCIEWLEGILRAVKEGSARRLEVVN